MNTFQDIFKKSFLSGSDMQISPLNIFIIMLLSLGVAAFIYLIYKKFYRGVVYSHSFNVSVAMMTVITAMIISTISSNVILSLGMVGALSIVRFRTAIKDPIDLIFLFWAVAAGIAVGAKVLWVVLFGNLAIGLTFVLLSFLKKEKAVYLLVVNYGNDAYYDVDQYLSQFQYTLRSKMTGVDKTEMTIELYLKDNNTQFIDKLSEIENVDNVALVSYNGDFAQ